MIKRKFFVILIFMISCCCLHNFAYSTNQASIYLESKQKTVEQGEEIEITVNLKNQKIVACNFSLYFDSAKLEFIPNKDNLDNTDFIGNINLIDNRINFVWFDPLRWRGC